MSMVRRRVVSSRRSREDALAHVIVFRQALLSVLYAPLRFNPAQGESSYV